MGVVSSVLRGRCVRKDFVVGHIVVINVVSGGAVDGWRTGAQITDDGRHSNVHDIVAEASSVRPATGNYTAAEPGLNLAGQDVPAKNPETREAGVIRIGRVGRAAAREPRRAGRE